jgi:hypothetical protein
MDFQRLDIVGLQVNLWGKLKEKRVILGKSVYVTYLSAISPSLVIRVFLLVLVVVVEVGIYTTFTKGNMCLAFKWKRGEQRTFSASVDSQLPSSYDKVA